MMKKIQSAENVGAVERFIDIFESPDTTGETLCNQPTSDLEELGLSSNNLVGYSFDGAANMASVEKGLQGRLKRILLLSVYIHCCGHRLNLVFVDTCKRIAPATDLSSIVQSTAVFLSEIHKRLDYYKNASAIVFTGVSKLRVLVKKVHGTRWWIKSKSLTQLFGQESLLPILIFVLETIIDDTSFKSDVRSTANGLLNKWSMMDTIVNGLKILCRLVNIDDEVDVESRLLSFAKNYDRLKKSIGVELRPEETGSRR
ncbi:zinc finger MYM-type protein 1-like [Belonocnema kinseyi]|uniref:zinc finger MYM-type protein 1-like n=1 Tax=Belonocnema kinseyi TaxID=2817044 RepID=UPI00143D868B|nr:zinc finger MYM-type protein 1-like [Belonocnema kinseyi]